MTRSDDSGIVLVNVLVILAIASAMVLLMLDTQDLAIEKARNMSAASAAEALALSGEASVVTELRRDQKDAADSDHPGETWAAGQEDVRIATGQFSIRVSDAQSRLNLARLRTGSPADAQIFLRLFTELDLPAAELRRAAIEIAGREDIDRLADLQSLSAETTRALTPHVDFLPAAATLNFNTAEAPVIAAVLNNPSAATRLLAIRSRTGQLKPEDFGRVGVVLPPATGLTSNVFDAVILAEVDGIEIRLESRIQRSRNLGPQVIRRRFGKGTDAPFTE